MVFVSHAWVKGKPDGKVLSFVNMLRENGYDAKCDVMITQQHTAIHFQEMMAKVLKEADKTIIVLSKDYKTKADNFQGGVGEEYRYIIEDFKVNPNKYILVSFEGRNENIIPDFIRGRDIVDLAQDIKYDYRELYSKLSSVQKYEFAPVASQKTIPTPEKIKSSFIDKRKKSSELGLNFTNLQPISDLDKNTFIKESFDIIISLLEELSEDFCENYTSFNIEHEMIDQHTVIFEFYKNKRRTGTVQIWLGSMMGGTTNGIFISNLISNGIGGKNSWNEMIICKESNNQIILELTTNTLCYQYNNDGSVEEITKQIWQRFFVQNLRLE